MLNISNIKINHRIDKEKLSVFQRFNKKPGKSLFLKLLFYSFLLFLIVCFLPWTQNVQSKGYVTTLYPDQRPQTINSIIAGKLEKWFVKEGDFVKKGDTILFISEVKSEYFDPELLNRTTNQIQNKEKSIQAYDGKLNAMNQQLSTFRKLKDLKLEQAKNKLKQARLKVKGDSVDFLAFETQFKIAEKQFKRTEDLYKQGLKSMRELENSNLKVQEAMAKAVSQENKLLVSRNEVVNAMIEISNIQNEYLEKSTKVESEQFSVKSEQLDATSNKVKLQNQFSNYQIRQGLYYITAPTDGYSTKLIRSGIGETIKEGEELMTIMPSKYDLAVEFYVEPIDYPLIKKGEKIRLLFDGWPAIFFRGWPNTSFGTYGAVVFAIDNFTSPNGKFRVMAIPDPKDKKWPNGIRVGGGVKSFALLNDVPVWYELWRNLNGFPPEYYEGNQQNHQLTKKK
ncbi:MAG: biotin/lipoyl-binding protein [Flavobacteriia bacterium]|nr:biotin/lipoyl-binding protein [Flavobacteriia bacterium]